ncbi:hypothetical protein U1Q18_029475 [Sarracenia purpurea var. burkii]
MSPSEPSQNPESNQTEQELPDSKTLDPQTPAQKASDPSTDDPKTLENQEPINTEGGDAEEEEEEGECGFCLFMKAGGCRDSFIAWEKCIEESEKNKEDIVEKCFEITGALKTCMEAHSDYYAPILRAEKAAEEEAMKEFEKEKAQEAASSSSSTSDGSEDHLSSSRQEED